MIEYHGWITLRFDDYNAIDKDLRMVKEIKVDNLILNHFSSRYSNNEINQAVRKCIQQYRIQIPVFLVYPGEIKRDILNSVPINR